MSLYRHGKRMNDLFFFFYFDVTFLLLTISNYISDLFLALDSYHPPLFLDGQINLLEFE